MKMTGIWTAADSTSTSCAVGCKSAACGRESDLSFEGVGVRWDKAGRSDVVEPRRAELGGGEGQSGGGDEAADAVNSLWAAVVW